MCQPGKPSPQGLSQRRICSGSARFPEREVFGVALFVAHSLARSGFLLLDVAVGELAVIGVFGHVEIDAAVDLVGALLFRAASRSS